MVGMFVDKEKGALARVGDLVGIHALWALHFN